MLIRLGVLLCLCLRLKVFADEFDGGDIWRIKHEPTYFVAASKTVRPGQIYTVNVAIFKANGPISVRASVQREGVELAHALQECREGHPESLLLRIPPTSQPGIYRLRVEGEAHGVLGGAAFRNETELHFAQRHMTIFIQSDKPIYRQGGLIRFRAVPVTTDLKAFSDAVDVFLLDSRGIITRRWLSRQTNQGAVSLQYRLSKQPRFGNWTIRVVAQGQVEEKTIYIEEYYQTPFEVNVTLPAFILESEQMVIGSITANYTSGAPVTGNLTVKASLEPVQSHKFRTYGQLPEVKIFVRYFEGHLELKLPMRDLRRMTSHLENSRLTVVAEVGERYLDQVQIGFAQSLVFKSDLKLAFLGANPQVFKPAMPFKCYVAVSFRDGSALPSWRLGEQRLELRTVVRFADGSERELEPRLEQMSSVQFGVWELAVDLLASLGSLPLLDSVRSVMLEARYEDETGERARASLLAYASYTPTNRRLQVTTSTRDAKVGEYIIFHVRADYYVEHFSYLILSKGSVLLSGVEDMPASIKTFAVPLAPEMAPTASVVVYDIARQGELIADCLTFPVDGLALNNFSVSLNNKKDKSGETVEVVVEGRPGTYVALSAVDHVLHPMRTGSDLSPAEVLEKMNNFDEGGNGTLSFAWQSRDGSSKQFVHYPSSSYGMDAYDIFQYAGLVVFTDAHIPKRPNDCGSEFSACMDGTCYRSSKRCDGYSDCSDNSDESGCPPSSALNIPEFHRSRINRVERMYDGSWMWKDINIGPLGHYIFNIPVPSIPTSWIINAFGMNPTQGFGLLVQPVQFSFTRPFVMNVEMPTSCKIGEQLGLRITIFNYFHIEIETLVMLAASPHYHFVHVEPMGVVESFAPRTSTEEQHHLVFVKSGKSVVVYMPIVATTIGDINVTVLAKSQLAKEIVIKPLTVEPDGVPQNRHTSVLLDLSAGAYLIKYLDTNVTESPLVPFRRDRLYMFGSNSATLSITGDVVGAVFPTMPVGTESLLQKPDWCGEQNMFNFASNLYSLLYLRLSGQRRTELEKRAFEHLNAGYQRQLSYQQSDGSFSPFRWDSPPSVWLTAFCARILHKASSFQEWESFIFVDPSVVSKAVDWLLDRQSFEGAFMETSLYPYDRKMNLTSGRLKDTIRYRNISLTAHALITLVEVADLSGDVGARVARATRSAQRYLEKMMNTVRESKDPYEIAIVAYALTLVNSVDGEAAFNLLDSKMRETGGQRYWSREYVAPPTTRIENNRPHVLPRLPHKYDAHNVETTAYGLLTHVRRQAVIQKEIVNWLNSQRNTDGGWASTQDTIVALEALIEYAVQSRMREVTDITVTVEVPSMRHFTKQIHIDDTNIFDQQTVQIPGAYGTVVVRAQGSGVALVQLSVKYHVDRPRLLVPPPVNAFELDVKPSFSGRNNSHLHIRSCQRWTLLEEGRASGMTVLDVSLPTGYIVQQHELHGYARSRLVRNLREARFQEGRVLFYFENLDTSSICVNFVAQRWFPVANMTQYLPVRVYDYYAPERFNETILDMYNLFVMSICQVCGSYQCPYCPVFSDAGTLCAALPLILLLTILLFKT